MKMLTRKWQKIIRNESQWRRNEIPIKRNTGKSYINWKNKEVQKRILRKSCTECRLKCHTIFFRDHWMSILQDYWDLGDVDRQRDVIYRHIKVKTPRRIRPWKSNDNVDNHNQAATNKYCRRRHAVSHFLPSGDDLEETQARVCQVSLSTHFLYQTKWLKQL